MARLRVRFCIRFSVMVRFKSRFVFRFGLN